MIKVTKKLIFYAIILPIFWVVGMYGYVHELSIDHAAKNKNTPSFVVSGTVLKSTFVANNEFLLMNRTKVDLKNKGKFLLITEEIPIISTNDVIELMVMNGYENENRYVASGYTIIESSLKAEAN